MSHYNHLNAIELRLSNECMRRDVSSGKNREWREHNIRMIERERQNEIDFLAKKGIFIEELDVMTMEDVLAELEL